MDWLNEAPTWPIVAPLLMWIKILEICAVVLLILALLAQLVGWLRHLSWRTRLSALLPLAASVGAASAGHSFHDTYVVWVNYLNFWYNHRAPPEIFSYAMYAIGNATQAATILGWVALVVTGILLVLGLVGMWRLIVPGRHGNLPAPLAIES